jgi:hypothetical protein
MSACFERESLQSIKDQKGKKDGVIRVFYHVGQSRAAY